jgi:uridine phosphorylase
LISTVSAQVISSRNSKYNNVPDYYYANYKFVDDWNAIFEWFTKAKARYSVGQTFSTSEFVELSKHFDKVFPNLTDNYKSIYEKCSLLADSLSKEYSNSTMEALLNNSCYNSLNQAIRKISSNYTVKAVASLNPAS